jgi:hypothetical protein
MYSQLELKYNGTTIRKIIIQAKYYVIQQDLLKLCVKINQL